MKIRFILARPDSETPTAIRLRFHYKKDFWFSTGQSITPDLWDSKTQRPLAGTKIPLKERNANPKLINQMARIKNKLESQKLEIENYVELCKLNKTPFDVSELREKIELIANPEIIEFTPEKENFVLNFIKRFVDEIESGTRLTPGKEKKYRPSTVKAYREFIYFWESFEKSIKRKVRFEDVTDRLYRDLLSFCHGKNFRHNYTGRRVKELKRIMNAAHIEGIHENTAYKDLTVLKVETKEISLTENEIQLIRELDLSDNTPYDKARDLFLIGCYTALRFSDIIRLKPENIIQIDDGHQIEIYTKKTSTRVVIPIRPELMEILKKHDYAAPKLSEQKVNERIKEIAKLAGITGSVNVKEIIGGNEVYKNVERCEMIKTHTARRTAATLMYKAKIPTIEIMKITGHKKESVFLNYIKISNEEAAARMRTNPFFRGNPLKRVK